jgi:type II secretory pathway predicted ATPase ExeA
MYEEYWKLKERPFHNTVDPKFFYHSVQHDEALMKLTYAVSEKMGAAMLTGAYGCGKTMLSRVLLQQLGANCLARACMAHPGMAPADLLRAVARAMSDAPLPADRSGLVADALLENIERAVKENRRDGKHTVLIIDEAHMLDNQAALETSRLFLNYQQDNEFLMTVLFLGHLDLAERVAGIKQLAQRIPITCTLGPLGDEDTAKYVQTRLSIAGRNDEIFTADALNLIGRNSGGIPRRINTLCDVSLTLGYAQKVAKIDTKLVLAAVEKFGII